MFYTIDTIFGWLVSVPLTSNAGHMYEDASSDLAPFKCNFYINLCSIWEKGSSGRNWRPGQCMNAKWPYTKKQYQTLGPKFFFRSITCVYPTKITPFSKNPEDSGSSRRDLKLGSVKSWFKAFWDIFSKICMRPWFRRWWTNQIFRPRQGKLHCRTL